MNVAHAVFGKGEVVSQNATTVDVNFNGVTKHLLIKYANLKMDDGRTFTAAAKPKRVKAPISADLKKMSDSELVTLHNSYMHELLDAKEEARMDGKTGTL